MAGVRKKPNKGGKYQGWYIDSAGKRKFFTGTKKKTETLRMAERFEDEHRQIRLGYRPPPDPALKNLSLLYEDVVAEYIEWGEAQGGRKGKPWGEVHARNRRNQLARW